MLKAHVALKVAEMKVNRHDEALTRARAAKRNPQNDPVLQFLAENCLKARKVCSEMEALYSMHQTLLWDSKVR